MLGNGDSNFHTITNNHRKHNFFLLQLQEVLLSYITNPQLELALVMLIVPFIVNVSDPALPYCYYMILFLQRS